jgi:hypothetical protein
MNDLDRQIHSTVKNICEDAGFTPEQKMRLVPVFKLFNAKLTQAIDILAETSEALKERDKKIGELEDTLRWYQDNLEDGTDRIELKGE